MATNPPPATPDPHAQPGSGFARGAVRTSALGDRGSRGKPFFLTSEFLALVATAAALLIAAAVADNFEAPHVWTLVALLSFGYILSRGLAKHEHRDN